MNYNMIVDIFICPSFVSLEKSSLTRERTLEKEFFERLEESFYFFLFFICIVRNTVEFGSRISSNIDCRKTNGEYVTRR